MSVMAMEDPRTETSRRFSSWARFLAGEAAVKVTAVLLAFLITGATVGIVIAYRSSEISSHRKALGMLAATLSKDAERTLSGVQMVMDDARDQAMRMGFGAAPPAAIELQMHKLFETRTDASPELDTMSLTDADGNVIAHSKSARSPKVNLEDRDYFRRLKAGADFVLSEPLQGKTTGHWQLVLARRVIGGNGEMLGAIVASLNIDYFRGLYADIGLGKGVSVVLWRKDGTILYRYPESEAAPPGSSKSDFDGQDGVNYVEGLDGKPRMRIVKASATMPVAVSVSIEEGEMLAQWRRYSLGLALAGLACICAAMTSLWALARRMQAYQALGRAVAEKSKAERERESAQEEVRQLQKMEAIGRLSGGIAHDFNNMLAIIIANLDLAKFRLSMQKADPTENIVAALESANSAAGLTKRLLSIARRQELEPEPIEVEGLVAGMSDLLSRTLGQSLRLEIDVRAKDSWVLADRTQLESAILNLAVNARDAMGEGGTLTISARKAPAGSPDARRVAASKDFVVVSVSDTGTGMDPETAKRAFEPFYTTKGPDKGTGLGLSQVYGFARQSGGLSYIETELGKGTKVNLLLPACAPAIYHGEIEEAGELQMETKDLILVVDDEPALRKITADWLEMFGYEVITAADAPAALDVLSKRDDVKLLLTDIVMPGTSGLKLARDAVELHPDLNVLYTSGYSEEAKARYGSSIPSSAILAKPFQTADLLEKVRAAIAGDLKASSGPRP